MIILFSEVLGNVEKVDGLRKAYITKLDHWHVEFHNQQETKVLLYTEFAIE